MYSPNQDNKAFNSLSRMDLGLRLLFFILFSLALNINSHSQDVHFSQKLVGTSEKNPAFALNQKSKIQFNSVYREQWAAIGIPFTTIGFAIDAPVYKISNEIQLIGGLLFLQDKSGDAGLLWTQFNLHTGLRYSSGRDQIIFSLRNTYQSKSFQLNSLKFPDQYDRSIGGFNNALPNGESNLNDQTSYYQLGFGTKWHREINTLNAFDIGWSMLQINSPSESFMGSTNVLSPAWGIQLQWDYQWKSTINLRPWINRYQEKKAEETIFGSGVAFEFASDKVREIEPFMAIRSGISRNLDALIIGSYLKFSALLIGASYDINLSELELASNNRGAFEITLRYQVFEKTINQKSIPCVRY